MNKKLITIIVILTLQITSFCRTANAYISSMHVDENDNIIVASLNDGLWKNSQYLGMKNDEIHAIHRIGKTLYIAIHKKGIHKISNNGITWGKWEEEVKKGLESKDIRYLAAIGDTLYACTNNELFKLAHDSNSWKKIEIRLKDDLMFFEISGLSTIKETLYLGIYGFGVIKSTDGGNTWKTTELTRDNFPLYSIDNSPTAGTENSITLHTNGESLFASVYKTILKSSDGGDTWKKLFVLDNNSYSHGIKQMVSIGQILYIVNSGSNIIKIELESDNLNDTNMERCQPYLSSNFHASYWKTSYIYDGIPQTTKIIKNGVLHEKFSSCKTIDMEDLWLDHSCQSVNDRWILGNGALISEDNWLVAQIPAQPKSYNDDHNISSIDNTNDISIGWRNYLPSNNYFVLNKFEAVIYPILLFSVIYYGCYHGLPTPIIALQGQQISE